MEIFYAFMIFIVIAALIAVETRNLLSAVICIGAAGFGGAMMFLFLRAPDIAITQITVEVLALIILIRATINPRKTFVAGDREFFGVVVSVVILLIVFMAGAKVFETFPPFGTGVYADGDPSEQTASDAYVADALEQTGAANVVAAVILDYRAYDTLGEATVLFTSILGATVLLRSTARIHGEDRP